MRKVLIISLLILGCSKNGTTVSNKGAVDKFNVEFLFEVDGCKVYRFEDYRTVQFTNCKGATQWTRNCGKNCRREMQTIGDRND